jgi:polyphosphate glucokinase
VNVLVIDVGGSHVKLLATGQKAPRKLDSGRAGRARAADGGGLAL